MNAADSKKIEALLAENASLKEQLARYKPQPLPPPKIDGVFQLPSDKQIERLTEIVLTKWPQLRVPERDIAPDLYLRMVKNSMHYVSTLPRMKGALERTKDYMGWIYGAQDFLRMNFKDSDVRGSSLMVAVLVSNDICHTPVSPWWPRAEFGLVPIGAGGGDTYSATNRWLAILGGEPFNAALIIEPVERSWTPYVRVMDPTGTARSAWGRV
jgi:hypothetical protein